MKSIPSKTHFHFIGIGGIGMSGLATIIQSKGFSVSGSDKTRNQSTIKLEKLGVLIFNNQNASNLIKICEEKKDIIIVVSSAIPKTNKELQAAYKANLKIVHRSDVLAYLIENQEQSILIAGSHGKTTTSTLITTLFAKSNQDPTAIIGGILPNIQSNALTGKGNLLIAEIDESDGSITKYKGDLAIITNLELDHTDHYKDIDSLISAMQIFANKCKVLIANHDCKNLRSSCSKKTIWWSTKQINEVDFAGIPIKMDGDQTIINYYEKSKLIDQLEIPLPGKHNLSNTIGAIAASRVAGLKISYIKNNLQYLSMPKRRFEFKGVWEGRQIIDDYAHHPSEVRETIAMAKLIIQSKQSILPVQPKRLVIIFQPHRYSRTKDLMFDFAKSLGQVDLLLLAPIYSAGEKEIKEINIQVLKECVIKQYPKQIIYTTRDFIDIENIIREKTKKSDLILIMGAGDINKLSENLIAKSSSSSHDLKNHAA